ncbi:hypothetical protein D3C86_1845070 [compost metagenome]
MKSVSGYQAFRRYYADGVSLDAIVEFLILNTVFPRSVHYALHAMDEHLRGIELLDKGLRTAHDRIIRHAGKLKAELACLELEEISLDRERGVSKNLLQSTQQLGIAFAQTFFRMGEVSA